jgi:hypothetical protein
MLRCLETLINFAISSQAESYDSHYKQEEINCAVREQLAENLDTSDSEQS